MAIPDFPDEFPLLEEYTEIANELFSDWLALNHCRRIRRYSGYFNLAYALWIDLAHYIRHYDALVLFLHIAEFLKQLHDFYYRLIVPTPDLPDEFPLLAQYIEQANDLISDWASRTEFDQIHTYYTYYQRAKNMWFDLQRYTRNAGVLLLFLRLTDFMKRLHDFYYERIAGAPDNSLDSGFFEGDPSDEAESDVGDENEEEGEHVLADDTLESEPATEAEEGEIDDAVPETEAEEELDDTLLVGDIDLEEYLNSTEPAETVVGGNKRKHSEDDDDNDEPPTKKQETEVNTQN
ncbi:uncharacterized protein LOC129589720 [Paramacrobiotus metropolitanus]|uniref:uncharacterized protein LOC129580980 n=1 Tax=Paramacrobiotus metropolitanus TaxID=2943436 RepID=UPI0024460DEC|nr:uncharacterized protein LOC129580980 [Paramacrobiotus metropolitanus]XP_055337131.1 uncharacterized protein LOC129587418 [Paramacrobiotus metropolitanus]XP_055340538.1 uncharacterized protein LOC129589720 [Paramacrobiotus metropolitanus]